MGDLLDFAPVAFPSAGCGAFAACLATAERIADAAPARGDCVRFDPDAETLRSFWMPREVG